MFPELSPYADSGAGWWVKTPEQEPGPGLGVLPTFQLPQQPQPGPHGLQPRLIRTVPGLRCIARHRLGPCGRSCFLPTLQAHPAGPGAVPAPATGSPRPSDSPSICPGSTWAQALAQRPAGGHWGCLSQRRTTCARAQGVPQTDRLGTPHTHTHRGTDRSDVVRPHDALSPGCEMNCVSQHGVPGGAENMQENVEEIAA